MRSSLKSTAPIAAAYPMTDYAASAAIVAAAAVAQERWAKTDEPPVTSADVAVGDKPPVSQNLASHPCWPCPTAAMKAAVSSTRKTGRDGNGTEPERQEPKLPRLRFVQHDLASGHVSTAEDEGLAGSGERQAEDQLDVRSSQLPILQSGQSRHHADGARTPELRPSSPAAESQDTPASAAEKQKRRRESHKQVERRRREAINDGITALSKVVPGCDKNRRTILDRSVLYVQELQEKSRHDQSEVARLQHELEEAWRKYEDLLRGTEACAAERARLQRDNVALRNRLAEGISSLERVGSALVQSLAPAEAEALSVALSAGLAGEHAATASGAKCRPEPDTGREEYAVATSGADSPPELNMGMEEQRPHRRKKARTNS